MDEPSESDERLMIQVAQGRADRLELLVRRYATMLLTFICRLVVDRHRGEELFQEVFLAVWTKRRTYRFPQPFRPWLYKIALNRCRQELRRKTGHLVTGSDPAFWETTAVDPAPDDPAVATENRTLVADAVATLPPRQRTIVVMRVWNGLSYGEIARTMGVREATVRSNMHDALANLRRYMEPRMS